MRCSAFWLLQPDASRNWTILSRMANGRQKQLERNAMALISIIKHLALLAWDGSAKPSRSVAISVLTWIFYTTAAIANLTPRKHSMPDTGSLMHYLRNPIMLL